MRAAPPFSRPRGTRLRHAALAVGLIGCLTGCESSDRPFYPFAELEGKVISGRPFLVVPNRAWRRDAGTEIWYFAHSASLICQVDQPPAEPIVFGFLPADGEETPELGFLWDGEDVSERLRREASGELALEIPAASLTAGVHFLSLRRRDPPGADEGVAFHRFRAIGYRHRGETRALPARDYFTFRYLSSLLSFGLTGSFHRESLGGFVLAGPRSLEVDLGGERGGLLQFKVQNSGAGGAVFRFRWRGGAHEERLEPHQRRHVRLALPPGAREVGLVASGDPNGFFLWGAPHFQPRAARPLTPVVLMTLDTTRRDAFGVYGGEPAATPRLDAFAARATVYENAFTTAPWTLPAHASIFTGLYPSRHGAGVHGDHLEIGFSTLAERLRRAGYVTAGFAGGMLSSGHFGVGQGFGVYRNAEGSETKADELTAHARRFLADWIVADDDAGREVPPFFLFVNFFDPHFPYRAPPAFWGAFGVAERRRAMGEDALWQATLDGSAKAWESVVDGQAPASAEALAALRAAYLAEVAFVDEEAGGVLARLKELGLYDRALILVTADHGELLGESGLFSHSGRLDGELVEVPLIVKWPGQRQGRRDGRLTSLVDLFPTILAAAGEQPDGPRLDGRALAPGGGRSHAFVIAEEHGSGFHVLPPRLRIADHLFAVLGLEERRLRWDGGGACFTRAADGGPADGWRRVTCNGRRSGGLEILDALERDAHRPRMARIGFSREERQRLEALGYLR